MATATVPSQQTVFMQGVGVPASSVRPPEFFAKTRRKTLLERAASFNMSAASQSTQDVFELRKSDILSTITVRFTGSLVLSGAATPSYRWPYDLLRQVRFTANGASNLINVSGLKLKAREQMRRGDETDRGVQQQFGASVRSQGTLAMASESWGVGPGQAGSAGTYAVDLTWHIPVSEDEIDLSGAIFLATSTSDLTLTLDYEQAAALFNTPANVSLTGSFQVVSTKFSVPIGSDGNIVVPNLNVFHSLVQSTFTTVQNGENEVRLVGQGAGKSLLRSYFQTWNGAGVASQPLAMTAQNYGKQSWRFGNNETPDEYPDGSFLRAINERTFTSDVGALWGFGVHDFANENAFRDVVDMGTTSELRLVSTIQSGVTLTSPKFEYVTETAFLAGQGA